MPKKKAVPPIHTVLEDRINEVLERKIFPSAVAWSVAAGQSNSYVGTLTTRLRQGKVKQGKFGPIAALARAAGVSVHWLTGETDIMDTPQSAEIAQMRANASQIKVLRAGLNRVRRLVADNNRAVAVIDALLRSTSASSEKP